MAGTFRGESLHKVDAKGRVSIPALFRRVLEEADPARSPGQGATIVLNYGDHLKGYVECFTAEAADEIDSQIKRMKRGSPERRMLERLMQTQSHQTIVDEDGRLVLPKAVRDKAGLGEEALFAATGDTFQIWNPATYEAQEAGRARAWLDAQGEDFDPLTLLPDLP